MVLKTKFKILLVCAPAFALALTSPAAWAQSVQSGTQGAIDGPKSTAPNVRTAADDTQGANSGGSGANSAIGQALMATGAALMSNPPTAAQGAMLMAMGIMAMMQAGNQAGTASGASGIGDLVDYGYTNPNTAYTGSENDFDDDGMPSEDFIDRTGLSDAEAKTLISNLKDAKAKGLQVDPKTGNIKLPNGKSISPEDASTPQSLAGAGGFPLGDAEKAFDTMNSEVEKMTGDGKMIAAMDVEEGGAGGGGGGSYGSGGGDSEIGYGVSGAGGASSDKDKKGDRKLAGMSKNFHGEPIGVSSDNIFIMMTRRYQLKQKQDFFLREDEGK